MGKRDIEIDEITQCTECGSENLNQDHERGELVCDKCGLVLDDSAIDQGKDWRSFDSEQDNAKAHSGPASTLMLHDKGLSTGLPFSTRDSSGKNMPMKNRAQWYRMRKWQRRIRVANAVERNLVFALSELDRIASSINLPRSIRETAVVYYKRAIALNLIRGRSIEGVVAACLYASCRKNNVPRTLDEIGDVSKVSRKELGRTYRFLVRSIGVKLLPTSPQDYILRFCSELQVSNKVIAKASEIIKEAERLELTSGRGPTGVAAAAIYIASVVMGERRTQREVAEIGCVTEVTIRNRYKELSARLDIDVNVM